MTQNLVPEYITGNSFIELARRQCGLLSEETFKDIIAPIAGFIDIYPVKNGSRIHTSTDCIIVDCPPTACPPTDCPSTNYPPTDCPPIRTSSKQSPTWWIDNNAKQNDKKYKSVRWREIGENGKVKKPARSIRLAHEEEFQKMWKEKVPLKEVLDYIEYCRKT